MPTRRQAEGHISAEERIKTSDRRTSAAKREFPTRTLRLGCFRAGSLPDHRRALQVAPMPVGANLANGEGLNQRLRPATFRYTMRGTEELAWSNNGTMQASWDGDTAGDADLATSTCVSTSLQMVGKRQ